VIQPAECAAALSLFGRCALSSPISFSHHQHQRTKPVCHLISISSQRSSRRRITNPIIKIRPTIFISGVSSEFGVFRDAVENEIEMKGCFAENQPGFPPDYRTVEEMLRHRLQDSDAVILLVGFRFGAEPNQRPANVPRRSYTQMEFDIARELQKPVYVFLSSEPSVRQAPKPDEQPEDAEATALQRAHRDAAQKTNHLYYFFKDQAELCKLVAEIPLVQATGFKADISHFDVFKHTPAELIGRESETALLNDAWLKVRSAVAPRPHILTFVALGGEGKTSLVAKWAADLAHQGWPGCDAVFAWSFYSQGAREQNAASSDLFLSEALTFFGDVAMAGSAAGEFDKGRRLAQLVGERRTLLILDGLEPLQYVFTSLTQGELKDQGLSALLRGLAANSRGLCVITTRYAIPNLRAFIGKTVQEEKLTRLSTEAGVALLQSFGVKGGLRKTIPSADGYAIWNEYEKLVEDVNGHALTLNLLGGYLRDAHAGNIRQRELIKLEEADTEEQGGHAFRVMDAYVRSFESGGKTEEDQAKGRRALALLQLLGLFDRPATADCLKALWQPPAIKGLTEVIIGLGEAQRNLSLKRLEDTRLLTVIRARGSGELTALDTHPLLREYFAQHLRQQRPKAWRAAHRRLYKHLCKTAPKCTIVNKSDLSKITFANHSVQHPSLEDLQPLYQAIRHGCQANLVQETYEKVWTYRIRQGDYDYSARQLGAYGSNLGAIACFFEVPWSRFLPLLTEDDQSLLLYAFQAQSVEALLWQERTRAGSILALEDSNGSILCESGKVAVNSWLAAYDYAYQSLGSFSVFVSFWFQDKFFLNSSARNLDGHILGIYIPKVKGRFL
jgi:uncharacterized protein DUF4062